MEKSLRQESASVLLYGVFVVLFAFLLYLPVLISGEDYLARPYVFFTVLAGLSPLLGALIFTAYTRGSLCAFLREAFSFHRFRKKTVLLLVVSLAVLTVTPVFLTALIRGEWVFFAGSAGLFLPVGFLFGGLEEIGWRGFMQKRFDKNTKPIVSSLVVGVFWSIWHLPLFFIEGTYQASLGVNTPAFYLFLAGPVLASPFYAFLLVKSRYLVPLVILYHGLSNVLRELLADPLPGLSLAVEAAMSLAVVVVASRYFFRSPLATQETK